MTKQGPKRARYHLNLPKLMLEHQNQFSLASYRYLKWAATHVPPPTHPPTHAHTNMHSMPQQCSIHVLGGLLKRAHYHLKLPKLMLEHQNQFSLTSYGSLKWAATYVPHHTPLPNIPPFPLHPTSPQQALTHICIPCLYDVLSMC